MSNREPHLSLSDVHESVDVSGKSRWKRIFAFFGPAYLVSVGYMDPGNWATDLAGGSAYGYTLIWVLLMSNLMALLLQSLAARMGIVLSRDLAQCNRELYPKGVNFVLYLLAEIAIAACDLAEVLGMAIGLNLLLGIPLKIGVLITLLDTVLLLYLQRLGMRKLEAFIVVLVAIIGICFLAEMIFSKPSMEGIVGGFVPRLPDSKALYIAIGIIGATVMPHNLYLHSALVQTRKFGRDNASIKKAIRFNTIDSGIALNLAFFVNAAILILAAAAFFSSGHHDVASLQDAHKLLQPLLGNKWAAHLFAIALIAAGQSSTVTGTLAGQIIMEGYLRLRLNPVLRRLITRLLAIVPAMLVLYIAGDDELDPMLVFSQVLLSMQLAFAIIPLIHIVSDKSRMKEFAIGPVTKTVSWLIASIIIYLNLKLVFDQAIGLQQKAGHPFVTAAIWTVVAGVVVLLIVTFGYPLMIRGRRAVIDIHPALHLDHLQDLKPQEFRRIALALDYGANDRPVMEYALKLGARGTKFILIHIVESASARMIGNEVDDYETRQDRERLETYRELLSGHGYESELFLGFHSRASEIARIVKEQNADLLITGSHGHKGVKDLLFGETINSLRHLVQIPLFIAK